jgi:Domain of unknown function (DUF5671)
MTNIRRVYLYLVSLISLGILAAGVRGLLFLVFDYAFTGSSLAGRSSFVQQQVSLAVAELVIGGPLWFFFWRAAQNAVKHAPAESNASLRKLYLNLILLITSLMALFNSSYVLQTPNSSGSLATLLVVAAIWYYHWRISETEGSTAPAAKTLRRWYVYILAAWALIWLAIGVVQFVDQAVIYLPIWGTLLVKQSFWSDGLRTSISWIVLGGLWWAFHWFRMSRADVSSTLRQVYIYLLAIIVSSVAGLTALIFTLYQIIVWVLGVASDTSGNYFQFLGWTIPTIVVGAAVWVYHQYLSREEAAQSQESRLSSKRVHLYIMSFLGLGTGIAGIIILVGIILGLWIDAATTLLAAQPGWWQKQLALCLSFVLVAAPLWWYYWTQIVRSNAQGGIVEWQARSRRIYLYLIIGAAIVALAADMVNIVYQVLNGILTGSFDLNVLINSRWSIQSAVAAVPVLIFHWRIARENQHRGAESAAVRKNISILAGDNSRELIRRLEKRLGTKIRVLRYSSPNTAAAELSDEELEKVAAEVESSPPSHVMLLILEGQIRVFSYQE